VNPETTDPARTCFTAHITHPDWPMAVGERWVDEQLCDRGRVVRTEITVPAETQRTASGIEVRVVHRVVTEDGVPVSDTVGWYAQDTAGNVWYYGEDTAELDATGKVTSTEGTWRAGVRGARPGIYMPAHPRVGQTGRQEYYKGHAEDHFKVLKVGRRTLLTQETTPLEPGVVDHKTYKRGVGTVLEQTVKGGDERNTLVSFHR
jgi:hypothetical protein